MPSSQTHRKGAESEILSATEKRGERLDGDCCRDFRAAVLPKCYISADSRSSFICAITLLITNGEPCNSPPGSLFTLPHEGRISHTDMIISHSHLLPASSPPFTCSFANGEA